MSIVNLVCRDGVVYSHKIVLASVSGFVETLLSDIPVGDDVGVFLSDFSKKEVNKLLTTKGVFVKEETEDCSEKGSGELTEYLVNKSVLDEEKISEDEFTCRIAKDAKYPTEMTRRERLRLSAKWWRDNNHEIFKLRGLQDRLEIKKRSLKDSEFNATKKDHQAERKRRSRSRASKKAAEQLTLL